MGNFVNETKKKLVNWHLDNRPLIILLILYNNIIVEIKK